MVNPYDLLTKALTGFYTTPNTENYKVVLGIYARAVLASVTDGDAFTKNMTDSIMRTLASFNLIDKANRDINDTKKLIAAAEIPTGAQYGIFILNKTVGDEIFVSKKRQASGLLVSY
jgi:hypothetical protein